jgi:hypothetical protein
VQKTDEPPLIDCGDALDNMTSELKANEYISVFVSGGPKNYAYKICNSVTGEVKTVLKCGVLHSIIRLRKFVNFDTIKYLVLNARSNSTVTVRADKKIKRKTGEVACVSIVTKPEDKIYRVSFFQGASARR